MIGNRCNTDLPVGWVFTDIDTITLPITTVDPKRSPESYFRYLDISGIDNSISRITEHKSYLGKDAPSRARQLVRKDDVLFSTVRTYLKNIAKVPLEYDGEIASTGFSVLRAAGGVDPDFLFYFTLTPVLLNPLSDLQRGSSYPAVRDSDVRSQGFPLPPLPEQRRIVAKIEELFSELDKGIESFKTAREQLKVYRQALLKHAFEGKLTAAWREENQDTLETADALLKRIQTERADRYRQQVKEWEKAVKAWEKSGKQGIKPGKPSKPKELSPLTVEELAELPELPVGWGWVKLASVSRVLSGYAFKSDDFKADGVPVIKIANIGYSEFVEKDQQFIAPAFLETCKDFIVTPEDVLLALTRPITNNRTKVCKYPKEASIALLNQRVSAFKEVQINSHYLYSYCGTSFFKEWIRSKFSETLQPNLSPKDLENSPIPVCDLSEQVQLILQIESLLSEVDQLDQTFTTALQQAETLRQSILKKAFSGQLVPQDPNDEPAAELLARITAEREARSKSNGGKKRTIARKKKTAKV